MSGVGLGGGSWVGSGGGGPITGNPGTFAAFNDSGVLSSAPGWSFDDTGALRVGAQDSLTIPAGVTDYLTMTVSPTVGSAGLANLTGLQINPAINQTITQFSGFQIYGYGTDSPTTSTSFLSNPNWAGTTTTLNHFVAGGTATTTDAKGYSFNPNATAASVKAFSATPQGSVSGAVVGLEVIPTTTSDSIKGVSVNLSGATTAQRAIGLEVEGGSLFSSLEFTTTSSLPALVDSGNIIRPVFKVASGSPITDTDVIMSNLSGFMDIRDDMTSSSLELGAVSVGFVSQVAVEFGKTLAKATMCLGALAVEPTSANGTIAQANIFNATAISLGGSLRVTNLYGYHMEARSSRNATNTWGVCIDDDGAENYLAKSLMISGATKSVFTPDIALEIGAAKSLRLGRATTAEKEAMTDLTGLFIYDTTLAAPYYNDGTQWLQVAVGPARIRTASATLDFPNIGSNSFADLTVSVPGAALSDVVSLGIPNAVTGTHLLWTCWVSAAGVVTVRCTNPASGAHNPPSGLFKVMVTQF